MKKLCLMFFASISTTLLVQAANTPMPAVTPKEAVTIPQAKQPKAKTVVAAKTAKATPKAAPVAKAFTPKVVTVTPIVTPKAEPVDTPMVVAKESTKSVTTATPTTSATTASTKTAATTKLPVQINIKNTSNFAAQLTGFTIIHKDRVGNRHSLSQTISNTKFKIHPASAKKILPIAFNLKAVAGTFFVGTSAIFINNQQISTIFKNEPWNSGMTDAIYVTSKDGTTWSLDQKAMKAAYQKASKPTDNAQSSTAGKVTSITKAATVPIVQHEPNQQKEMVKQLAPKKSKSAKASAKAVNITAVNKPTIA